MSHVSREVVCQLAADYVIRRGLVKQALDFGAINWSPALMGTGVGGLAGGLLGAITPVDEEEESPMETRLRRALLGALLGAGVGGVGGAGWAMYRGSRASEQPAAEKKPTATQKKAPVMKKAPAITRYRLRPGEADLAEGFLYRLGELLNRFGIGTFSGRTARPGLRGKPKPKATPKKSTRDQYEVFAPKPIKV